MKLATPTLNARRLTATDLIKPKKRNRLSVIFFNREGEPEATGLPALSTTALRCDLPPFTARGDTGPGATPSSATVPLPHEAALNRLRRALFETGQVCVTTKDDLARVCFAGVGDPERLLVEVVPRDEPVPAMELGFPGCLCTLRQAEAILRRVYRGEPSDRLAASLNSLALGRRKRRVGTAENRLQAA